MAKTKVSETDQPNFPLEVQSHALCPHCGRQGRLKHPNVCPAVFLLDTKPSLT